MEDASKNEILEAIGEFSNRVDDRFVKIEGRLTKIEATMVTKDYLDDKLLNMKGDMVVMMRTFALEPFPNR